MLKIGHEALLPDGRTLESEVRYVAANEMVQTLADIVLRRLDLGTGSELTQQMLAACARVAAQELSWDTQRQSAEISRVKASYPFSSPSSQES